MRIWDKVWLMILSLLLMALGVGLIWIVFYSERFLFWAQFVLQHRFYPWVVVIVGAAVIVLAVAIVSGSFARRASRIAPMASASNSQVNISFPALEAMVRRASAEIAGIKELKPEIKRLANGIGIYLHVVLLSDVNIPELVNTLQERVKSQLETMSGLNVAEVKVYVANVAADGTVNKA